MQFSQTFIPTLKEAPAEATLKSHILMIRSGMIRKVGSGLYSFLPYGLSLVENIKQIVREEMNDKGALEMAMPILVPQTLLGRSGRWQAFKSELFRLIDRNEADFALSPTNEENFTQLILEEVSSYRQLPINLYQINHKFRDEIRPRYGVMRGKEFIMKDAYSFHLDDKSLDETYKKMSNAYHRIFKRCGLDFVNVKADSGTMGGKDSEEFMVKSDVGEEFIIHCSCGYTSNSEAAEEIISTEISTKKTSQTSVTKVYTPNCKTISQVRDFFSIPIEKTIKTMVYEMHIDKKNIDGNKSGSRGNQINSLWKPFIVIIRGDYEVNPVKLEKWVSTQGADEFRPAPEEVIFKIFGSKARPGSLGIKSLVSRAPIVYDVSLKGLVGGVMGANEEDYHFSGIDLVRELSEYDDHDIHEVEVYTAQENGVCPRCRKSLQLFKGIEVGHIFKLGRKYTESFDLRISGKDDQNIVPTMGCYGIGVTRLLAACVEQMSDDQGIILPPNIAPYKVVLLTLNPEDSSVMQASQEIYHRCKTDGLAPLWDDRVERAGFKFKDADLLGIPLQVVIGKKSLLAGKYEIRVRARNKNLAFQETIADTHKFLLKKYQELLKPLTI